MSEANMKSVFITGAASGIGLTTAKLFAAQSYFVGLYDINLQALEEQLASADFPHACGIYCDVTNRDSINAAFKHFADHSGGKLDILVNNAGVLSSDYFADIPAASHDLMIDVNVKGFTHVAQAAYRYLKQTPKSVMVNLCSASSIHGIPLLAVYSATKFYVNGLTEALNIEWAQDDIRVVAIKPPIINNRMGESINPKLSEKMAVEITQEDVAHTIMQAINGNQISYIIGSKTKAWAFIDHCLPQNLRHKLVKYLTGM